MYRKIKCLAWLLLFVFPAAAQSPISKIPASPKLVVGLVIDQMRWDYLYRYQSRYQPNGFKRLLNEGFSCQNTMIPYTPTYTAPGHACVYTGSVPAVNGIVGNNWYNSLTKKVEYCTDDSTVTTIGNEGNNGKMSPANMWTTTITDELRLSNQFKSRVYGIALKDRGAILPAGHSANGAFWYDDKGGKWISSSYYMKELPIWLRAYNYKDPVTQIMSSDWNTLLPIGQYDLSTEDDKPYESNIKGEKSVTFPHALSTSGENRYVAFRTTPFANTYTFNMAKLLVENEKLGSQGVTDFLTVSISSTDYIGHSFGPNSIEIEDTYLRLDRDIAAFLEYLDTKIGKGNYLVFLTADHGVAHIPAFLAEHHLPGGTFNDDELANRINNKIKEQFGIEKVILSVQNYQLYLNHRAIQQQGKLENPVKDSIIQLLKSEPFIVNAFATEAISQTSLPAPQKERFINGYHPKRSGDIQFTFQPAYFDGGKKGTTHGLWNPYDAHIPLLFYGWKIPKGALYRETYMTDIAPTLAALLHIQMPNGCVGKVIEEVVR